MRHLTQEDIQIIDKWVAEEKFYFYRPYKDFSIDSEYYLEYLELQHKILPPIEFEALIVNKKSKLPVGLISLSNIDYNNLKAELSVYFHLPVYNKCLCETLYSVFHWMFNIAKFHKIYFYVLENNYKIINMVKKYGFTCEAFLHEEILNQKHKRLNVYRFYILNRDWLNSFLKKKLYRIFSKI